MKSEYYYSKIVSGLPADVRKSMLKAMQYCEYTQKIGKKKFSIAMEDIAISVVRSIRRAASDKRTDAQRRKLVGARVPIEDYQRYRLEASSRGLSLYRWVRNALESYASLE